MPRKCSARLLVCFLGLASTIPLPVRGQAWDFMGDAQINSTRDHEKIQVTRRNAFFQAIQLRVSGDAVFFDHLVVHFGDGTSEEMAVQGRIWPGGKNRIIGLSGERSVESVELWYYKEPWEHKPRVILYGS